MTIQQLRVAFPLRLACFVAGHAWAAVIVGSVVAATVRGFLSTSVEGNSARGIGASALLTWVFDVFVFPMAPHVLTVLAFVAAVALNRIQHGLLWSLGAALTGFAVLASTSEWLSTDVIPWLALGLLFVAATVMFAPSLATLPSDPAATSRLHRAYFGAGLLGTLLGPVLIACFTLLSTITDPRAQAKYWIGETLVTWAWGGSFLMVAAVLGALVGAASPRRRRSGAAPS